MDTVKKLLDHDKLVELAEFMTSDQIDDIVIFYRDKRSNQLDWATTHNDWRTIIGQVRIGMMQVEEDFNKDGEDG